MNQYVEVSVYVNDLVINSLLLAVLRRHKNRFNIQHSYHYEFCFNFFLNTGLVKDQMRAGSGWDQEMEPYLHTSSALFHPSRCPKKRKTKNIRAGESMTSVFATWQI